MNFRDERLPNLVMAADLPMLKKVGGKIMPNTLLSAVRDCPEIIAIKIGVLTTAMEFSLEEVVLSISSCGKGVIYDMQKMGRDSASITGEQARLFSSVADAVVIDPETREHWRAAYDAVEKENHKQLITVLFNADAHRNLTERIGLTTEILRDIYESGGNLGGVMLPADDYGIKHPFFSLFKQYGIKPIVFSPRIGLEGELAYGAARQGTDVGIVSKALCDNPEKTCENARKILDDLKRGYESRKSYEDKLEQKNGNK